MEFPIVDSSEQAKATAAEADLSRLPFDSLTVGKSFLVAASTLNSEVSLRSKVSREAKKRGWKLHVVRHLPPHDCFEVARSA